MRFNKLFPWVMCLLFFMATANSLFAQDRLSMTLDLLKKRDLNSIRSLYLDTIAQNEFISKDFSFQERRIVQDYEQTNIEYYSQDDSNVTWVYYFNIISLDSTIVFYEVVKGTTYDLISKEHRMLEFRSIGYLDFINEFKKEFPNCDPKHPTFNPPELMEVGYACGGGGGGKVYARRLIQMVRSNNKDEILQWCYSVSPEIRLYGATGLQYLYDQQRIKLRKNELQLVKKIASMNTPIKGCDGCTLQAYGEGMAKGMFKIGLGRIEEWEEFRE